MTLRAKLLALFLSLAVVPLLALGGVEYARSLNALEALIAAQNARVAGRAADAIATRLRLLRSDLALFAENAETGRWLSGYAVGREDPGARTEADRFVRDVWARVGTGYRSVTYRSPQGAVLLQLGADDAVEVLDPVQSPTQLGSVALQPALATLIPLELLATGFGQTGYGMVLDRGRRTVLYHPQGTQATELANWPVDSATLERPSGTFRYRSGDTVRVASFISLSDPRWTVVVSGTVAEFAGPFTTVRRWTLVLFLLVAALATLLFSGLLRRTTRSLEELTAATAVVGQGDFAPALPQPGRDEVGRLTASFAAMVGQVRGMMRQIESSRQLAVLGEFAAHLSHEIRNPLTSIKLNLQKLDREEKAGRLPEHTARPLQLALLEVDRLDGVVRGVLDLTRTRTRETAPCGLHQLVDEVLETIAGQAEAHRVAIQRDLAATRDAVQVDVAQVKGALLNLVLNALDTMPDGGTLSVATKSSAPTITITVTDTGPGIPATLRDEIFRPFYTTRPSGTGLGLPLAKRAIEDQGGTLTLAPQSESGGAQFVIELPLRTA